MVETAAAALLRAGYGKDHSVALFLGNSPDHPVNFFGALKAGARVVHLSARSTAKSRCRTSSAIPARACSSPATSRRCCRRR